MLKLRIIFLIGAESSRYRTRRFPSQEASCPESVSAQGHNVVMKTKHYTDVIMGAIASQITSLTIVYSIVYSDADQRKHQRTASLAFVQAIHRGPVNSPHKWPVTQKMFPFDDVIMRTQNKTTTRSSCARPRVSSITECAWPRRRVTSLCITWRAAVASLVATRRLSVSTLADVCQALSRLFPQAISADPWFCNNPKNISTCSFEFLLLI